MQYRKERMAHLLRNELNKLIQREIEMPGSLATITNVTLTKDLDSAKVLVGVVPKEKERETIMILKAQEKTFRHLLIKKLNWRLIPELSFEIDYGAESASQVEKLLLEDDRPELKKEDK